MPLEGFKKKKKKWGKNAIFGRKMRRYDFTNMDFIAIFQKKCVFKGKSQKKQEDRGKMPFIAWKGYKNGQNLNM